MTTKTTYETYDRTSFCPSFELADKIVDYIWLDITIHLRHCPISLPRAHQPHLQIRSLPPTAARHTHASPGRSTTRRRPPHIQRPITNPILPALEFLATLAVKNPDRLARLWVAHRARVNDLIQLLQDGAAMFRLAPTAEDKPSTVLSATGYAKVHVGAGSCAGGSGTWVSFLRNVRAIKVAGVMDAFVTVRPTLLRWGTVHLIEKGGTWTGPRTLVEYADGFFD
ncbi:hypothetical protein HDU88_003516 [Geranomyces variabilis]|nr:hypothetical protein HDU88_003516 [Geranomyces variabilis]